MRWTIAVWVVTVVLSSVGCAPPGGEYAGLVQPETLAKADLQYYWHVRCQLERGEQINRMDLVGDRLYCLTNHNRLLALDAARGIWLWSQDLASPRQRVFTPVHADKVLIPTRLRLPIDQDQTASVSRFDAVILNTLSEILVLDRSTGEKVARIPLDFPASTSGAVGADADTAQAEHYFLASFRGWYYSVNLSTGLQEWGRSTGGFLNSAPVYYDGILYVAGEDNVLYAVKAGRNAVPVWSSQDLDSQPMHGAVTSGIHVDSRGCFVPCQDNRLYAYNPINGRPLWEPFVCQQPLQDNVQVGDNSIFLLARRDNFYAIDVAKGAKRWSLPLGRLVLATMQDRTDRVYLLDADNNLRVLDEMTGKASAVLPMTGLDRFLPNTTVPAIYAATRKGRIVCIRLASAGYLTPEMFQQP
jgi:hypothetical protein